MSEGTMTFSAKLLQLYERFEYVQKTGKNEHFRYKFFQESVIKSKLNKACRELGLVIARTTVEPVGECTGKAAVVKFTMDIADTQGGVCGLAEWEQCRKEPYNCIHLEGIGGGMDSGDKAPMKALVSAMKYAIANGLMVETGDDPEDDPKTDEAAIEAVRVGIEAAKTPNDLEYLKPQLAALKGCDDFGALKDAFKVKKAALTAN